MNSIYDFDLPENLIAQEPAHPRDHARLLVYSLSDGKLTDSIFYELEKFLYPGTTLAINNSKVENCRWLFPARNNGSNIEIFVLEKNDHLTIRALVRPGRKFRPGKIVELNDWLKIETLAIDSEGIRTLKLNVQHDDSRLKDYEHIPLPPYIKQNDELAEEYQTVYAKPEGSLAAPTAGLHFTPELLSNIASQHKIAEVTLHVGLGTFAKLTEENIKSGRLHNEHYFIDSNSAYVLNKSQHITAVGTTTTRTLESAGRPIASKAGSTDIFIKPGYKFKVIDSLITNFHLPSTSLLMLVSALIADKRNMSEIEAAKELKRIYEHAIKHEYRFYSFGDAMLLV